MGFNMNKEKYREAGKIASEALEYGKKLIRKGKNFEEIVQKTEDKVHDMGGKLAFPVNLSVNEKGAHDTASINDKRSIESGLIKLDVGVHVDGWIADNADTVVIDSDKQDMVQSVRDALNAAIEMMTPGTQIDDISERIEETIRDSGYNPVRNLTGHGLAKYDLHAKLSFPNVKSNVDYELKDGDVFAIEPFATDGSGYVIESDKVHIYKWEKDKPVRSRAGRKILKLAKNDYCKLPFAKRWLTEEVSKLKLNLALRKLTQRGALYKYPVLREKDNGDIAQAEHTIIVGEEPEIITRN